MKRVDKLTALCKGLFELLEHADFSNGVGHEGMDEGNIIAGKDIAEYKKKFDKINTQRTIGEMKVGDRVQITIAHAPYFKVGDKATLTRKSSSGSWWADFDDREFSDGDKNFSIQPGFAECEVISD